MRVRTVYFKVRQLGPVQAWWQDFLGAEPTQAFARLTNLHA